MCGRWGSEIDNFCVLLHKTACPVRPCFENHNVITFLDIPEPLPRVVLVQHTR